MGAVFLMATSAIGPGFLTQTGNYTASLGAAFACAIVLSILVDIAVQMNVWRVIGVSGRRAQDLGNEVLPGIGYLMSFLVVVGGLVFNVGNVAGSGLGLDALLGLDPKIGGTACALVAIGVFLSRRAGMALDRVVVGLGLVMILAALVMTFTSSPPVGQALVNVVAPEQFDVVAITTIVGGTVGGYITYAGAHRMLDSGTTGPEHATRIGRSAAVSIVVTGVMRILLFLAILGVVEAGSSLSADDPVGSAFEAAAGGFGLRTYGLILTAAAITSVIGAAYTSVSFMTKQDSAERTRTLLTVGFIVVTTVAFVAVGEAPVTLLVFAGTFNGILLPIGFGVLLWIAWRRRDLLSGYRYPGWLLVLGVLAWAVTLYLGYQSVTELGTL